MITSSEKKSETYNPKAGEILAGCISLFCVASL